MNSGNGKDTYDMNPVTKGIFGFVGTIITALTIGTWTTVNSTNVEVVRLQTKLSSVEEKVSTIKDDNADRLKDLNSRMGQLENRVSNLEKK